MSKAAAEEIRKINDYISESVPKNGESVVTAMNSLMSIKRYVEQLEKQVESQENEESEQKKSKKK